MDNGSDGDLVGCQHPGDHGSHAEALLMSWEDGGPLDPPEVIEVECPRCKGDGIDPDDQGDLCMNCDGEGLVGGDQAVRILEDAREDMEERRFDQLHEDGLA